MVGKVRLLFLSWLIFALSVVLNLCGHKDANFTCNPFSPGVRNVSSHFRGGTPHYGYGVGGAFLSVVPLWIFLARLNCFHVGSCFHVGAVNKLFSGD